MLRVYSSPDPSTKFSDDGTFSNPLAFSINGQTGAIISRKFFLRNDDAGKTYTGITLQPVINSGIDIVSGTVSDFNWKLIAGNTEPTEIEWAEVTAANTLSMDNITDSVTYLPFWLRIEVPRGVDVQVFQGVSLEIVATEA